MKAKESLFSIAPTSDRVLIRRIESPAKVGSIFIPDMAREELYEGIVVAAGPGRLSEKKVLLPMTVHDGMRVVWGKYSGIVLTQDDKPYVLLREDEIVAELVPEEELDNRYQKIDLIAGCSHETSLLVRKGQLFTVPLFCEECAPMVEDVQRADEPFDYMP